MGGMKNYAGKLPMLLVKATDKMNKIENNRINIQYPAKNRGKPNLVSPGLGSQGQYRTIYLAISQLETRVQYSSHSFSLPAMYWA